MKQKRILNYLNLKYSLDSTLINHKGNVYKITVNNKGPLVPLPKVDLSDHPGMRSMPEAEK